MACSSVHHPGQMHVAANALLLLSIGACSCFPSNQNIRSWVEEKDSSRKEQNQKKGKLKKKLSEAELKEAKREMRGMKGRREAKKNLKKARSHFLEFCTSG